MILNNRDKFRFGKPHHINHTRFQNQIKELNQNKLLKRNHSRPKIEGGEEIKKINAQFKGGGDEKEEKKDEDEIIKQTPDSKINEIKCTPKLENQLRVEKIGEKEGSFKQGLENLQLQEDKENPRIPGSMEGPLTRMSELHKMKEKEIKSEHKPSLNYCSRNLTSPGKNKPNSLEVNPDKQKGNSLHLTTDCSENKTHNYFNDVNLNTINKTNLPPNSHFKITQTQTHPRTEANTHSTPPALTQLHSHSRSLRSKNSHQSKELKDLTHDDTPPSKFKLNPSSHPIHQK
jgi:hypothetical protein